MSGTPHPSTPSSPKTRRSTTFVALLALVLSAVVITVAPTALAVTDPMSVSMTATPNPVSSGSTLTYTIVATNREPQQANVRLTDQLHGLTNVSLFSSRGYCSLSSDLVTCEAGSMPGGNSTWTVTITGRVTAANGQFLANTATVVGNWSAQNTSQTFTVPVQTNVLVNNQPVGGLADLSVSIIAPSTAAPLSNQTYQMTINNSGAANATDIDFRATLPNGFLLNSVSGTSLFNCSSSAAPNIVCLGGAVNAGANATITMSVKVSATSPPPNGAMGYQTTAVVDPENAIAESNELNNTAQHTLSVPAGPPPPEPVTFTKTAVSTADEAGSTPPGSQARPGDTLTYTITVKNTAPKDAATRVQVTDGTQGLDQAAVSAKSSDPKLVCANSNALVKCAATNNNYTLNAGATVTITISGRVVQAPSSIITNTATLQTLQGKASITRTATITTIVRPQYDLTVTQYATCTPIPNNPDPPHAIGSAPSLLPCPPFRAHNQFDYLITVGNSGLNTATGVVIREPLPPGVIFEGYENLPPTEVPPGTPGGFTCQETAGAPDPTVVTCTGGTVPGQISTAVYQGTIRQIRLHLTAPNVIGPITATVTADPFNTLPESDETNNTATTVTPIATGVDLTITQAVRCPRDTRIPNDPLMCNPVAPSGTLVYDILVTNVGTQDAAGIAVSDILPTGARFRSAKEIPPLFAPGSPPYTPAHGLSCSSDGAQGVTCTGGALKGSYIAFGGPKLDLVGDFDSFTIEVVAFAPAPYGPADSPDATGSPILNQVLVDPANAIPEYVETNNLNLLHTNVGIPPKGDWGTYNELSVVNEQVNPVDGANAPAPVAPNGTLDYRLTVSNWGSDPVSNVVVQDFVPTGARFRNVTVAPLVNGTGGFNCSFSSGVVTCSGGALAASPSVGTPKSTTIVIRLFAPPTVNASTTQYTNHALVDPTNAVPEADETNNASDVNLTVDLPAPNGTGLNTFNDLIVENVQSKPVNGGGAAVDVAPNGTLEYTLTVKNRGSDPVDSIVVHDTVPVGSRFRTADSQPPANQGGFTCTFNAGVVQCGGGHLAGWSGAGPFPSATIKILLFAPDAPTGETNHYTNHAIVDPFGAIPEGDETNNTQDIGTIVTVGGANAYNQFTISTAQSAPAGHVAPNGTLVYRMNVENVGTDRATNIVVRDYLPAGTRFRSARLIPADSSPETTGFVCFHANGIVDCTNGTLLGGGGKAVIEIVLFAPDAPVTINNQAVVDPANAIPEGNEQDNTAISGDTVVALDGTADYIELSVSALTDTPDPVETDSLLTYVVTIKNTGTDDAFNVKVTDHLPQGTTFVSANDTTLPATTTGFFTCTESGGDVDCTGGHVTAGGTRELTVIVRSPTQDAVTFVSNAVSITNQVIVDPDNAIPEGDESNNVRSTDTKVKAVVDLEITSLTGSGSQGGSGNWKWTVKNNGTDQVVDVVVEVSLPQGVVPQDLTVPSGWSCQVESNPINKVTCQGNLAGGASANFDELVFVAESGTLHAAGIVDPNDTIEETNETNNTKQS